MDGSGVALITLIVLVVNFSAAPSDNELARAIATIAEIFSFMFTKTVNIKDDATLMRFLINFNILGA